MQQKKTAWVQFPHGTHLKLLSSDVIQGRHLIGSQHHKGAVFYELPCQRNHACSAAPDTAATHSLTLCYLVVSMTTNSPCHQDIVQQHGDVTPTYQCNTKCTYDLYILFCPTLYCGGHMWVGLLTLRILSALSRR